MVNFVVPEMTSIANEGRRIHAASEFEATSTSKTSSGKARRKGPFDLISVKQERRNKTKGGNVSDSKSIACGDFSSGLGSGPVTLKTSSGNTLVMIEAHKSMLDMVQ